MMSHAAFDRLTQLRSLMTMICSGEYFIRRQSVYTSSMYQVWLFILQQLPCSAGLIDELVFSSVHSSKLNCEA